MGKKGTPHRKWSKEEKLQYIRLHLEKHISLLEIERKYGVRNNLVAAWVKRYLEEGEDALEPKNGNPYAALHRSKSLSEVERLRLTVAKQEVEIARLKKGYWVEGVGAKKGIRYWQRKEYEVIEELKEKYPVKFLCQVMGVNRSGYYKWRQRQGKMNRYERDREELTRLLQAAHEKYPSHGYHRLAHDVFLETGWVFSHNLAHKCCKAAGIHSKARKGRYKRPGEESILFPNQVKGHWNATAPLQLVVSDMTTLKVGTTYWEWTILLDTFNNEILAHSVTSQRGSNKPYYHCLEQLKNMMDKREEQTSQVVFHTDQGAVYSSRAFCQAHHNYNILRSMSRGGTPTDNPIIEALNGWIKGRTLS